jgi:hypothetical protein
MSLRPAVEYLHARMEPVEKVMGTEPLMAATAHASGSFGWS